MTVKTYRSFALAVLVTSLTLASVLRIRPVQAGATFVVNATGNLEDQNPGNGVCKTELNECTLRAAIQEANALAGTDTITFNIGTGNPLITPLTALPAITTQVIIDGNTGGATRVQLVGLSVGANTNGLSAGTKPHLRKP